MNPLIQLKKANPLFLVAVACFGVLPMAQALLPPPPPDGGYPNGNTAEGTNALFNITSGSANTAIGFQALHENTIGINNTAIGNAALHENRTGGSNTATGLSALRNNRSGGNNTANGAFALSDNTGNNNSAIGAAALANNTTGGSNTATGWGALFSNRTGNLNTATGVDALVSNVGGGGNTANGYQALQSNQSGTFNTASGWRALYSNVTGFWNTAYGYQALYNHSGGSFNTANGINALYNLASGGNNIALGSSAGLNLATGSGNIYVGNNGASREDNTIRVGTQGTQTTTFIAGIRGSPLAGTSVVINNNGRLGTVASSQRFKDDIKPIDKASETIHALKPVTFRYKRDIDPAGTSQFGLVAEEVEKVNPDLVVRDADGEIYTVRYDAVNAMLLNEFLKEHRKVQELEATVIQQQKDFQFKLSEQEKQIEALTAGLQKVSAQLEASKPAPQVVNNP